MYEQSLDFDAVKDRYKNDPWDWDISELGERVALAFVAQFAITPQFLPVATLDIPCDCMVRQQGDGSIACRQCNGDFYACECPIRHSVRCES